MDDQRKKIKLISPKKEEKKTETKVVSDQEIKRYSLLTLDDVNINLKLLARVREHQKLFIKDNKYLEIDTSYAQPLTRKINNTLYEGYNRNTIIEFLDHLIKAIFQFSEMIISGSIRNNVNSVFIEHKDEIIKTLSENITKAVPGINNLKSTTYFYDHHIQTRLEVILEKLNNRLAKINGQLVLKKNN